jgi:general L-amino acid transport system permease protein
MTQQTEIVVPSQRPPVMSTGIFGWLRANLFSTWYNALLTILIVYFLARIIPPIIEWAFINAHWGRQPSDVCRGEGLSGACWPLIADKWRLMIFGLYPYAEQWRPALAVALCVALLVFSGLRRFWNRKLFVVWAIGLIVMYTLMRGGILGLTPVPVENWGGLPLTLGLSVIGLALAFPVGIVLALGRRSDLPAIRMICVIYIELIRGVPLITVLFMASLLVPLFLPQDLTINKLLRAQIGFTMFAAAYLAEVVRGGLQAIPKGQYEAADSLGLSYWQKIRLIVLPQALRISIPPLVNTFIGFFKDTSLVIIIGLYDLLGAAKLAVTDAAWRGFYKEPYLVVALIYFAFCFSMSRYSQALEKRVNVGTRR